MNEKILIVDDELDILKMLERVLKLEDYDVTTASGGKEAIDLINQDKFDLVITDIRMPEVDGLEVIKHVKEIDDSVEVIVLSGFATIENAIEALKSNRAFHFIMKPLNDIDSFFHVVSQALEKRNLKLQNQQLLNDLENANKNLEEQVKQKTADLNQRVKELEALQQELSKALQKAEVADRSKTDFISIISHEMKTPLNIILGNADLLLIKESQDLVEDCANTIKKTCLSFSEMLDDILLFTDLDRTSKKNFEDNFSINRLIQGIDKILEEKAKEKGLSFEISIDKDIPLNLSGKWRLIRQVIYNLSGNAIKFTKKGGCHLNFSAKLPQEFDQRTQQEKIPIDLIVKVSDTGIGIKKDQKQLIFDWFYQADQSITREYGGVGLGLTLCKKIIDNLGGNIWFESQENIGSHFFIQVKVLAY
jgi:signal transduction histidine kinase